MVGSLTLVNIDPVRDGPREYSQGLSDKKVIIGSFGMAIVRPRTSKHIRRLLLSQTPPRVTDSGPTYAQPRG